MHTHSDSNIKRLSHLLGAQKAQNKPKNFTANDPSAYQRVFGRNFRSNMIALTDSGAKISLDTTVEVFYETYLYYRKKAQTPPPHGNK